MQGRDSVESPGLRYRIDSESQVVHIEGTASGGPLEFRNVLRAALADAAFRLGFGFLRDRRGMEAMDVPQCRRKVAALREVFGTVLNRWAFVITDPANYGMARMTAFLLDGSATVLSIFDNLAAGVDWAGEAPALAPCAS